MGRTQEQKAKAEAALARGRLQRETREKGVWEARLASPGEAWSIDQIESMLVLMAFLVTTDGKAALPLFERLETDLAAMKRAEEVLERNNVRTLDDLETHFERARPMKPTEADRKGKARWDDAGLSKLGPKAKLK